MKKRKAVYSFALLAISLALSFSAYAENDVAEISDHSISANANNTGYTLNEPLTPGLQVLAYDNPLILCGVKNGGIKFSADDFNEYNGYVPSSITILSLPDSESGKLIHNSTPVSVGQSISALSLNSLYYSPISSEDTEFMISTDNTCAIRCILRNKDNPNNSPSVTENSSITANTRLDTAVAGYLDGYDIDGDRISYEIVSFPEKGNVSIINKENGQFVYHPYSGVSGKDSFVYRIKDSYGAYSEECTVELNIDKTKAVVYNDLGNAYYTSAANDMAEHGIMQLQKTKDGDLFNPDEPVSRIDFLVMAMKSLGAGEVREISKTPFYDDSTLSDSEKGYLAAAYSLGIIKGAEENGNLVFMPDDAVTGASAAVILNGILGLTESETVQSAVTVPDMPTWVSPAYCALSSEGIMNSKYTPWDSVLSRENVAVILSAVIHKMD